MSRQCNLDKRFEIAVDDREFVRLRMFNLSDTNWQNFNFNCKICVLSKDGQIKVGILRNIIS